MISTPISTVTKAEWLIWVPLSIIAFLSASLLMSGWPSGLIPETLVPFSYSGDGMAYLWNVQRAVEGAWYFENERSGFPFGSNHLDYPTSDTGSYVAIKILGLFFQNAAAVLNLYYLLGFSFCAVSAYLVSRTIGITRYFSLVVALIYTFTSFHFGRVGHLFFTWYFVAPLFFYVGFRLLSKQLIFTDSTLSSGAKLASFVGLLILASFGIYYAFFGCLVIIVCAAISAALHRSWKHLYEGLIILNGVILGVIFNVLPSLIHIFRNGENREGVSRLAAESELYALKITQLLLPRGDHRLDSFFEFASRYNSAFPLITENISASMGAIGSLGFIFLVGVMLISPFLYFRSNELTARSMPSTNQLRFQVLAALSLGLVLMGTLGGFSSLFAMLVSSSIRSWNRISIFVTFASVVACLMAIDVLVLKLIKPKYLKFVGAALAFVILVLGVLDQTVKPCHTCLLDNSKLVSSDKAFIQTIEQSLPKQSAIYQLPYMAYPDNGAVHHLGSYDQARGHLHSKDLKWSFGLMRGREGDWFYRKLSLLPLSEQVSVISAMGYAGVYIDRRGYLDAAPQKDKRCSAFVDSHIERLKNNCVSIAEVENSIANAIEANSTMTISTKIQKLVSNDQQLSFMPLKAATGTIDRTAFAEKSLVSAEKLAQANAYLLPIGFKLVNGTPVQTEGGFETSIDLRKDNPDFPTYVGNVTGLADIVITNGKRLGRWSDALVAKRVTVWLAKPLPKKFTLQIRAQAAGLNVGKPMQIKIGKHTQEVVFNVDFETKSVEFELDEPVYKIEFKPADPFSPARRWGYGDTRLIAVLFQEILITPK